MQYDKVKKVYGTNGPSLGQKSLLTQGKGLLPKTAMIVEFYPTPFSNMQQGTGLGIELCFANNWGMNSIYYNGGYDWINLQTKGTWNVLIGYQRQFSKRFAAFYEFYIFVPSMAAKNYVSDLGITYQLNKKLQLDLTYGIDLSKPNGNSFGQGGITNNF